MQIPMVNLKQQYLDLRDELDPAFMSALESTCYILGPNVQALEQEVAAYCGVRHAISCASGTDALHLALVGAGIGAGDEVITTPFTFIATAEAIAYVGATPVFVDIDPATFNLSIDLVEQAITERTKAVMPVHLFGQPADMMALKALCDNRGLALIEDCAQSFGAEVGGKKSGALGLAGAFSFFPSKNLGCFGDGGMVVTNDDEIARKMRVFRNHGSEKQYHHSMIGVNSRLDELQAVVLRVKLPRIDEYNRLRRRNAHRYTELFTGTAITPPFEDGLGLHVYHQYCILLDDRAAVQKALADAQIASAIYYPIPLHKQEVFAAQCRDLKCPVSEEVASRVLALPMFPELSLEQVERIAHTVLEAL